MSEIWKRVTKQDPCPVCDKGDWCQIGDFVVKCMRVESSKACPSGGWYHVREGVKSQRPPPKVKREPDRAPICAAKFIRQWTTSTFRWQIDALASTLGVLPESLIAMGACWSTMENAWAFPMRDEHGEIVGVRLRSLGGDKWSLGGSKQGMFVPGVPPIEPIAYLVEGPTDSAAALSIGLFPIGRASCNCASDPINKMIHKLGIRKAIIVQEMDSVDPKTGKRPGVAGAMKLKQELKVPCILWMPQFKDMREFVLNGGTRVEVEAATKNIVWTRK